MEYKYPSYTYKTQTVYLKDSDGDFYSTVIGYYVSAGESTGRKSIYVNARGSGTETTGTFLTTT